MSHHDKVNPNSEVRSADTDCSDGILQIDLRLTLDEVMDIEATALRQGDRREPSRKDLRRLACRIYEARRTRDKMLDNRLFGEPAWDMLLALYFMPSQGKFLSVSGLCFVSGVPQTTALRWQTVLTQEGLIERGPDEVDRRRQFIRLTEKGRRLMSDYLTRLFQADMHVPVKVEGNN